MIKIFKYVTDVSELSHNIIKNYISKYDVAIDATLGNGFDTEFLAKYFKKVYSFDIQNCAVDRFKEKNIKNVEVILDSHEKFHLYVEEKVDCIIYNLGFLPKGDKNITTVCSSTLKSLEKSLEIIDNSGIITIAVYRGHEEGKKEETEILKFVKALPKNQFAVMFHSFLNRCEEAPILIAIEKK